MVFVSKKNQIQITKTGVDRRTQHLLRAEPHIIIKSATISSLSTINRMAKVRINRWNKKIIQSIDTQYKAAFEEYRISCLNGEPDFRIIKNKEGSMRKQYLRLFWIRANQYGYPINKRIHNEKEGEMDDFNRILNAGGAILRDFFETRYPLPTIDEYDYSQTSENLQPDHPYLPSLDLAEIFRTHMQELAFTLFIRNVPINKVNKYFITFFHACRDLSDWIYAGGRGGVNSHGDSPKYIKKNFRFPKYVDTILRDFKLMIQNENFQVGRYITPSKMKQLIERDKSNNITSEDLIDHNKIPESCKNTVTSYFTKSFIDKFLRKRNTMARLNGDGFHKIVLSGLAQPFSLVKVIENGEKYNVFGLPLLIVAELRLTDYVSPRRSDLLVLAQTPHGHWIPIVLLDIKTQMGYECFIRGRRHNSDWQTIEPSISIKSVELSNENWQHFGYTRLRQSEIIQLNELEAIIKEEQNSKYGTDINLVKGIIRVAPTLNKNKWHEYQAEIVNLIIQTFTNLDDLNRLENFENVESNEDDQIVITNKNSDKKISMVLDKIPTIPNFDHVKELSRTMEDEGKDRKPAVGTFAYRNNVLYLFAKSNTPAGYSTAWHATYSHLLPYVVKKHKGEKIALIDLLSVFSKFTRNRFRADKSKILEKSLKDIEIIQWDLSSSKDQLLDEIPEGFGVYIFAGWEFYKTMISPDDRDIIESEIFRKTPALSAIYWVDEADVGEFTSKLYQQRTIAWEKHFPSLKSKIIFNLPTAPKKPSDRNPQYPEYRVIIEWYNFDQIKHYWKPLVSLRGLTNKFDNRKLKSRLSRFYKIRSDKDLQEKEISKAYELVPWLKNLNEEEEEGHLGSGQIPEENESYRGNLRISNAKYSKYSSTELKLLNIVFVKRDWISRSKRYVDQSLINSEVHTRGPIGYSFVKRLTTTFPINRNLLTPGYIDIQLLDFREKKRLLDTMNMLEENVLCNYSDEDIVHLLNLFEIVRNSITENQPVKELKELIKEWELITYDFLSEHINFRRLMAYRRHIYHVNTSPEAHRANESFFSEYGNATYLMMQVLYFTFSELTKNQLGKIWDDLLPYTLEMIGFHPKYENLMKTQYNSSLLWLSLHRLAQHLCVKNEDEILLERREGFMLKTKHGYSWLYIENYHPVLFYNRRFEITELVNQGKFNSIDDTDIIYEMIEESKNLTPMKISKHRYMGHNYIWIHINSMWELLGEIKLNSIVILNSILSFEIIEARVKPPKPENGDFELDFNEVLNSYEPLLTPDVFLKFGIYREVKTGYIDLDFYLKTDVAKYNREFYRIKAIDGTYFTDTYKMIYYLRELYHNRKLIVGDQSYRFDIVENTQWMSWLKIKTLVQSKEKLNKYVLPQYGLNFINQYGHLLFISPDDLKKIDLSLCHNLDLCHLEEKNMDQIRAMVNRLGGKRKYDTKFYNFVKHQSCFEISDIDGIEGFSKFCQLKLKEKYLGIFNGQQIQRLLSPSLQEVDDNNGETIEYLINLQIGDEEILQEDIHIIIMLQQNYQLNLWRRPPGSFRLRSDYKITKIIKSPNGDYLELHYKNMITGFEDSVEILGDANPCIANDNYKSNLEELRERWMKNDRMGNIDIKESIHYVDRMKIIDDHKATCENDNLHNLGSDEFTFVEAKKFRLLKDQDLYSVTLYVERSADTKDTEDLRSYSMTNVDLDEIINVVEVILSTRTHSTFLSAVNSEFELIYPYNISMINDLFGIFCDLGEEVLDEVENEFGVKSTQYIKLQQLLEVTYLHEG